MNTDVLISLVIVLLPLSFISERLSNLIKLYLPSGGLISLGNLRHKEDDNLKEKMRERKILFVSILSGEIVAFAVKADLFSIIESGKIGWKNPTNDLFWILGCFFTGLFLSWGSKFWHDLLGILLEVKNIRRATLEEKTIDTRIKVEQISAGEVSVPVVELTKSEKKEVDAQNARGIQTTDTVTLKRIEKLHPKLRNEAKTIYNEILDSNVSIRITDSLRTFDEQSALYAVGRTKPGKKVTNSKAGQSYHNYGLALDFCLLIEDGKKVSWDRDLDKNKNSRKDWQEVVAVFKHYGWEWGGDWTSFKDYPHFQKTFGQSTAQLMEKYRNNQSDSEGYIII